MNFFKKLRNIIKRGLVTLDRTDQNGQVSYMETVSNYESIKPYGFASIPRESDKPLVILINVNADEQNKVGLEYNNKQLFEGETLAPGEVAVYNPTNKTSYVIFKNDGETRLVGTKIALGNSTTELLQQVSDHLSETSDMAQASAVHLHSSIMGPTSVPTNAATFNTVKTNIDAVKALVDAIKGTIT